MPINNAQQDSRVAPPTLQARLAQAEDGKLRLHAPAVGLYRGAPTAGSLVVAGQAIGALEVLGVSHHLLAPAGATGLVVADPETGSAIRARRAVAFDDPLFLLDPEAAHASRAPEAGAAGRAAAGGQAVFRAPTSGRFYLRPGPGKPPFLAVGDVVEAGQAVGLIEVMKTFSRVHYGGDGLPARARVRAILQTEESDVAAGDPLLELEAAEGDPTANPRAT